MASTNHHPICRRASALFALLLPAALQAATVPAGFTDSTVTGGLSAPTAMEIAPDGRIFVCQQAGALRVIKNGTLLATPFLTVSVNSLGERGLLGVAFDPDFANNRYLYIYYTTFSSPIHNRVSRFRATPATPTSSRRAARQRSSTWRTSAPRTTTAGRSTSVWTGSSTSPRARTRWAQTRRR